MNDNTLPIFEQPIDEIAISDGCRSYLKRLGFHNLAEVITVGWAGLRSVKEFDYIHFNEIIQFLEAQNFLYLMERH